MNTTLDLPMNCCCCPSPHFSDISSRNLRLFRDQLNGGGITFSLVPLT